MRHAVEGMGNKVDINLASGTGKNNMAISVVHFTPNAYLISRKSIAKLTVLPSNIVSD